MTSTQDEREKVAREALADAMTETGEKYPPVYATMVRAGASIAPAQIDVETAIAAIIASLPAPDTAGHHIYGECHKHGRYARIAPCCPQGTDTAGKVVACALGTMHGRALTYTDKGGVICCDFCGNPADPASHAPEQFAESANSSQAPATGKRAKLANLIHTRLLGVGPDDQDLQLKDDDWRLILAALTPDAEGGV